jgi:drug/metabolite transporter (DMT)-like permease
VLTAFLLGVVLVQFESTFGMPRKILYILAFVACLFAVYSFSCYSLISKNHHSFLMVIAIANLSYCVITLSLVFYFYHTLTRLGVAYFLIEIVIVVSLALIEIRIAGRSQNGRTNQKE